MGRLRRFVCGFAVAAFALAGLGGDGQAQEIVADLSHREIAISTGFTGEELLLFGSTEGDGDIVVTVTGPRRDEIVRRKERVAGIWVNGASMTFRDAPAYFRVAASAPLDDIAPEATLSKYRIGPKRLALEPAGSHSADEVKAFREALIRNKQRVLLYSEEVSPIGIAKGRLFRTTIPFPANVPTGKYHVTVYLFKDGKLVSRENAPITVHKVGLEAQIFEFANEQAPLYGAIAILIALVAGWLAGVIFRRT